jgi:glucose/arabinose dehydrogenase
MRVRLVLLVFFALALLLVVSARNGSSASPQSREFAPAPWLAPGTLATVTTEPLPAGASIETVLGNMNGPIAMAFDPTGRIFYTEKSGAVRLIVNGTLQTDPVITFSVDTCSERGLLGIALDPNFSANHFVYVYYTAASNCGSTQNKVVRFIENNGVGSNPVEIFSSRQDAGNHNGGNIHFGPDGKLYISVGDNATAANAQDVTVKNGKMHRVNPDGSIPPDNPVFTQTGALPSLYAMGLRNSFDFTFDTVATGRIFASENGPNCDDEMNRIEGGYNYGWRANYPCDDADPDPEFNTIAPLWYVPDTSCCVAPTGIEVYRGTRVPQWQNNLFMCSYNDGVLHHFYLNADRTLVTTVATVQGVTCNSDLQTGTDGALYYMEGGGYTMGTLKRIVGGGPTPTPVGCTIQFSDVPPGSPFYPFVRCLACQNIISGYADGSFHPGSDVTRGQLSKIVSNAAGINDSIPSTQQSFTDMPHSNPFWLWIERLSGRSLITGYACGGPVEPCDAEHRPYFRWGANATRGQISKIVSDAGGYNDTPTTQTFTDVPASNTFYVWIERLAERDIMGGYTCGGSGEPCDSQNRPYFRWANYATRGQTAKIVSNTFFPGCMP